MNVRRAVKWVGIGLLLFGAAFGIARGSYDQGRSDGVTYERNRQVATYGDGWQDGQQDLINRAWNMHYHGKR